MTSDEQQRIEHGIVLDLLDSEHPEPWTFAELEAALAHAGALAVRHAVGELEAAGVPTTGEQRVQPSAATRRLDALGLIAA